MKAIVESVSPPAFLRAFPIRRSVLPAGLSVALLLAGCAEEPPPRSETSQVDSVRQETLEEDGSSRVYERSLVFTTLEGGAIGGPGTTPASSLPNGSADSPGASSRSEPPSDTLLVVPFLFGNRSTPGGLHRSIRGWVARGGAWEAFADEEWETPSSRTPWRIVPRGALRLVVGQGGAMETVIFREPPRVLELDLGEELVDWTGPGGSTYRLEETSVLLGGRSFEGITLDLARSRDLEEGAPGDWAFLVSGDSLQLVIESGTAAPPGTESAFRAFMRVDFRRLEWHDVTVEWTASRAYEPARRDVPAAWAFEAEGSGETTDTVESAGSAGPADPTTADGALSRGVELSGSFSSRSAQLTTGDGEGPVLPVDALFIVSGTVRLGSDEYPVQGLFRHQRDS